VTYPLNRQPDVATFTFKSVTTYVVDLTTDPPNVKAEGGAVFDELTNVELWAEGEIVVEDAEPAFLIPRDRELYDKAKRAIESAQEYGCEVAKRDLERKPGLNEEN
jgi:hypothetical protein